MQELRQELTPEERNKAYRRAYYQKHKEEICRRNRERYQAMDKEERTARSKKYRKEHREEYLQKNREYYQKNRKILCAKRKMYRELHYDEYTQKWKQYANTHKAEIQERQRKYYAANKERIKQNNKDHEYEINRRLLHDYSLRSIEEIQAQIPEKVAQYMEQWPFQEIAHRRIVRQLYQYHIYSRDPLYQDCYDAGMLAYLYTIHRCAYMNYTHVEAYLGKMLSILIKSALIVGNEVKHICRQNHFQEYRLEEGVYGL